MTVSEDVGLLHAVTAKPVTVDDSSSFFTEAFQVHPDNINISEIIIYSFLIYLL